MAERSFECPTECLVVQRGRYRGALLRYRAQRTIRACVRGGAAWGALASWPGPSTTPQNPAYRVSSQRQMTKRMLASCSAVPGHLWQLDDDLGAADSCAKRPTMAEPGSCDLLWRVVRLVGAAGDGENC